MKKSIYTIYDSVSEVFNNPFVAINNASAIRSFQDGLADQPHKEDYHLYHCGDYNDNTGILTPNNVPERIWSGTEKEEIEQEHLVSAV